MFALSSDGTSCDVVDSIAGKRSYKILIGSSETYVPVVLNWLHFYSKICQNTDRLYILCFDKATQGILERHSLNCSYTIEYKGKNPKIWLLRAEIVKKLINDGHDVLLSDSDAIWLRNPFQDITQYTAYDIISSRAAYPIAVTRRIGASLCMGFMYVKATVAMQLFFNQLHADMLDIKGAFDPDDQRDLNLQLLRSGLQYHGKVMLNSNSSNFGMFRYKGHNVRVSLLPHSSYRRYCKNLPSSVLLNSTVLHCHYPKSYASKKEGVQKNGLWVIRE